MCACVNAERLPRDATQNCFTKRENVYTFNGRVLGHWSAAPSQLRLDRSRLKKVAACNLLAWETEFGRVFASELYQHPIASTTASLYVNDLISFDE